MAVSRDQKEEILDGLLEAQRKAQKLSLRLRFAGKDEEARRIDRRERKLAKQIQRLTAAAMREWRTGASAPLDELRRRNSAIQAAIRDVKKNVRTTERAAKAVGLLDDVLEVALDLSKAVA